MNDESVEYGSLAESITIGTFNVNYKVNIADLASYLVSEKPGAYYNGQKFKCHLESGTG